MVGKFSTDMMIPFSLFLRLRKLSIILQNILISLAYVNTSQCWLLAIKINKLGNFLVIQRLGLCASSAGGTGSIPGWGTKILQTVQGRQKKKKLIKP